jgi:hypothetical protein
MLKIPRHIWALAALLLIYGVWINWWASSGFPLEGQICEIPHPPENCGSHNVFFYSAYRLASISNQWSALIAAAATIAIAWFTLTLNQSTEKLQRAFISLQKIDFISHMDAATQKIWWAFHIIWHNSGASPARAVSFYVARHLEDWEISDTLDLSPKGKRTKAVLGAKSSLGSSQIVISGDDLSAVKEGRKFLYFWGEASYRDIFDHTPDHVTKFFVKVANVSGDPTKPWDSTSNILGMNFLAQDRHNCADDDCDS